MAQVLPWDYTGDIAARLAWYGKLRAKFFEWFCGVSVLDIRIGNEKRHPGNFGILCGEHGRKTEKQVPRNLPSVVSLDAQ